MAGHCQEEPFFVCFNIDLSVMGKCFASVDELVMAATSPFCFIASVPDIAAFSRPETMAFVGSDSCLDFIMSVNAFVTAADISRDLVFRFLLRGFFFFYESLSHHSESSLFCAVDSSLYSEFMWYLAIQKVLSFVLWIALYIRNSCGIAGGHLFYQYLPSNPLLLLQIL